MPGVISPARHVDEMLAQLDRVLDVGTQRNGEAFTWHDDDTPSPAFKRWLDRISSGTFTKPQCSAWCHSVARRAGGYEARGHRTSLREGEARSLFDWLAEIGGVGLTAEHTGQGVDWLASPKCPRILDWSPSFRDEVLDRFRRFSFPGAVVISGIFGNTTLPVWRIHLNDGRTIDYHVSPWQNGPGDPAGWWWS